MNDDSFLKIEPIKRSNSMFLHPSPDIDIKVIKQIGDYSLGTELGSGAFGKVVLGKHILTNELVAIKILDKMILSHTPDDYQSVKQEINILKSVKHKHIVQLYEVLQTSRHIFIIMEYCEGKDLLDYILTKSKLSEEESLKYFQQLINALFYLHSQNIAHRDIKIDNMLLDKNRDLKLVDFGLSTKYPDDNLLDQPCGTVVYAAPEVLQGREYHGMLADVWSSGIVLYGMLSGYLPFGEQDDDINRKNIILGNIRYPSYFSDCVKDLLMHMLDLDPMTRYTLQEVRSHPWFNLCDYKLIPGIIIGYNIIPVDEKILDLCVTYNIDREKVRESVINNKYNSETALYYLLIKKLQKKGFHSVSDFCSDEFINFVLDDNNLIDNKNDEKNDKNLESEIKYNININANKNCSAPPDGKLNNKEEKYQNNENKENIDNNHLITPKNSESGKINKRINFDETPKGILSFIINTPSFEETNKELFNLKSSNSNNNNRTRHTNNNKDNKDNKDNIDNDSKKTNKNTSSDSKQKYFAYQVVNVNDFQISGKKNNEQLNKQIKINELINKVNTNNIFIDENTKNENENEKEKDYKILNVFNNNNNENNEILYIENEKDNDNIKNISHINDSNNLNVSNNNNIIDNSIEIIYDKSSQSNEIKFRNNDDILETPIISGKQIYKVDNTTSENLVSIEKEKEKEKEKPIVNSEYIIETPPNIKDNNNKNNKDNNEDNLNNKSINTLSKQKKYIDKSKSKTYSDKNKKEEKLDLNKIKEIRKINLFQEEIKEENNCKKEEEKLILSSITERELNNNLNTNISLNKNNSKKELDSNINNNISIDIEKNNNQYTPIKNKENIIPQQDLLISESGCNISHKNSNLSKKSKNSKNSNIDNNKKLLTEKDNNLTNETQNFSNINKEKINNENLKENVDNNIDNNKFSNGEKIKEDSTAQEAVGNQWSFNNLDKNSQIQKNNDVSNNDKNINIEDNNVATNIDKNIEINDNSNNNINIIYKKTNINNNNENNDIKKNDKKIYNDNDVNNDSKNVKNEEIIQQIKEEKKITNEDYKNNNNNNNNKSSIEKAKNKARNIKNIKKKEKNNKGKKDIKKNPIMNSIIKNYKAIIDINKSIEIKNKKSGSKENNNPNINYSSKSKIRKRNDKEIISIKVIVNQNLLSKDKNKNINSILKNRTAQQDKKIKSIYRVNVPTSNFSKSKFTTVNKKPAISIFKKKIIQNYYTNKKCIKNNKILNGTSTHTKSSSIHILGTMAKKEKSLKKNILYTTSNSNSLFKLNNILKNKNNHVVSSKASNKSKRVLQNNFLIKSYNNKYMKLFKSTQNKNNTLLFTNKIDKTNLNKKFEEIAFKINKNTKINKNNNVMEEKKIPLWKYIQSDTYTNQNNSNYIHKSSSPQTIKNDKKKMEVLAKEQNINSNIRDRAIQKNSYEHKINENKILDKNGKLKCNYNTGINKLKNMNNCKSTSTSKNKNINVFFINIKNYINNKKENFIKRANKNNIESSVTNYRYRSPYEVRELSESEKNKCLNQRTRYTKIPWKIKKKAIDDKIEIGYLYKFYMNKNTNPFKKKNNKINKKINNIKPVNNEVNNKNYPNQALYYLNSLNKIKYRFNKLHNNNIGINGKIFQKQKNSTITNKKNDIINNTYKKNNQSYTPQYDTHKRNFFQNIKYINQKNIFQNTLFQNINNNNGNNKYFSNIFDLSCLFINGENINDCYRNLIDKLIKKNICFIQKPNKSIKCFKNGLCYEIEIEKIDECKSENKNKIYCFKIYGKNGLNINQIFKNILLE